MVAARSHPGRDARPSDSASETLRDAPSVLSQGQTVPSSGLGAHASLPHHPFCLPSQTYTSSKPFSATVEETAEAWPVSLGGLWSPG